MKVLFVSRGYPKTENNKLGMFELDQAVALKAAGHTVAFAVVDIRSIRRKRKLGYNHFVDSHGIDVFEMSFPVGGIQEDIAGSIRSICFKRLYPKIEKEFGRPDIVHAHFLKMGKAAMKVCQKKKLPLVLTEHSSFMNMEHLSKRVCKRASVIYSACNQLITVSQPLADNLLLTTGCSSIVVHNIANIGVEKKALPQPDSTSCLFVSAGNLLPRKGFDILIRAFSKALTIRQNIKLKIFGEGSEREKLEKMITEYSLSSSVCLMGKYVKEDLCGLFEDASAFVLSSRVETFGVVYIEAMALGLPVIATKCGGPEDFVNKSNGCLVDVDDVDQLADTMVYMADHWRLFEREEISTYAYDHFSPEIIAKQITEVYQRIIARKDSSRDAQ